MASTDLHAKIRNIQVLLKSGTFDKFPGLRDRVCISGTVPDDPGRMACMIMIMIRSMGCIALYFSDNFIIF